MNLGAIRHVIDMLWTAISESPRTITKPFCMSSNKDWITKHDLLQHKIDVKCLTICLQNNPLNSLHHFHINVFSIFYLACCHIHILLIYIFIYILYIYIYIYIYITCFLLSIRQLASLCFSGVLSSFTLCATLIYYVSLLLFPSTI